MIRLSPSLMCANYLNLEKDVKDLERAGVDYLHIDIMDGHFVPNLSLNFDIISQVKTITDIPMDVHLMVEDPESFLPQIEKSKVENVTFHLEVIKCPIRFIRELKSRGVKAGIALNPATSIEPLQYLIDELDQVLVMTVEPGYAGQKFIPAMLDKIKTLDEMRKRLNKNFLIEVDGNISSVTGKQCIESGADVLVLGTASIFKKSANLYDKTLEFKNVINNNIE